MKRITYLKTLLVGLLVCGVTSAWAYTPALTESYAVTGYITKAYYNIANTNVDNMCPVGGDLRYRGSGYGLFNFQSGNRGADITLSVSKGDLIIFEFKDTQSRGVTINSVSHCTKNNTFTNGEFLAYDVNEDGTGININLGRAGCIIAILVMEKDASVETAGYTINYKYENETIATDKGNDIAVGTSIEVASVKWVDNVKYILKENEPTALTVVSKGSTLDVNMRLAGSFNYTAYAKAGETTIQLASGSTFEGESIIVPYSQYMLDGNKLYKGPQGSNDWYRRSFAVTSNNYEETITYSEPIDNVLFYTEGENIPGISGASNATRASKGGMGYTANSNTYVNVAVLSAGHYTIYARGLNGNSATRTANFKVGDKVVYTFEIPNGTNVLGNSETIEVTEDAILSLASDGSSASGVDWFYLVSEDGEVKSEASTKAMATIGANGFTTFACPSNVEIPTGVKAYTAKVNETGTRVNFTEITSGTIPANNGVLLEGTSGIITLNVVDAAEPLSDNDFRVGKGAALTAADNTTYFAMVKDSNPLTFGKIAATIAVPANKAYLAVVAATEPEARLTVTFDGETTAIKSIENAETNNAIYNLNGQRVSKAQKGLYIVNGKKTIVK